jgi:hypothetical protein
MVHGIPFMSEYGHGAEGGVYLQHVAARQNNVELLDYLSKLAPLPSGLGFVAACHKRFNVLNYLLNVCTILSFSLFLFFSFV